MAEKELISNWHFVHIVLPIVPFLLGGGIRLMNTKEPNLATLNFSDLAICFAILSLSLYKELLTDETLQNDLHVKNAARSCAWRFLLFAIIFLNLFAIGIQYDSLIYDLQLMMFKDRLLSCDIITLGLSIYVLAYSNQIHNKFGLGADTDEKQ